MNDPEKQKKTTFMLNVNNKKVKKNNGNSSRKSINIKNILIKKRIS